MNIRKFLFGSLILIVIGAVSYFSMVYLTSLKKKPEPPRVTKNIPLVKTQKITYSDIPISIINKGRLSSNHKVDIISEVQGKILPGDIVLKSGQSFKKDQLLFSVYDEEAKLALRAAKSRFLTSVANVLPDVKYDFEQNYSAWKSFFSAIDLNEELPELPEIKSEQEKIYIASKNIFNDYFTIQSSEIRLAKYQVYAPFNGSFSQVYFQEGSIANPGTRVASIIRTDLLELEVPFEVDQIKWLKTGQPVDLRINKKVVAEGTINRIADFIDTKTQSVLVYVDVPNTIKQKLFEGMYMDARFYGFSLYQVMKVPRSSVFNFDEVYLVENDKLKKTRVKIEKVDQEYLYFSGPSENSIIAIELPLNTADQMQVRSQLIK
ncbi:MAG: HlyD family efflux transporter periplasmic adaptor subunit [Bacteroidales bacterium]|nr:HlyD family efflux transporter periplasmic adaptor subunit [Bacteroidales bacterium]